MEWIVEGASLIFIGVPVASIAYIDSTGVVLKLFKGRSHEIN